MVPVWEIESALPGAWWPAVPPPGAAALLALQYQPEQSQWLPADALAALQLTQLANVVAHAHTTVPHYRERWAGEYNPSIPLTWEAFTRLPLLTRTDLRTRFDQMKSAQIPAQHGAVAEARTSGSTGTPVCVLKTELCGLFWKAFTLREHAWHNRNLQSKLAAIRQGVKREEGVGWGTATQGVVRTGRAATLSVGTEVGEQLQWLQQQDPDYLLSHPTNLGALAQLSIKQGVRLPRLREARTSGEVLSPEVRALCREAWGVSVADMYSTNEVGYIALQCLETGSYHVMAEGVVVEIIDDAGRELGVRLPGLKQVRTYGEMLRPDARAVVREAWGVEIADSYSSEELGYIALQCPASEQYHAQSESLIVEVLRADGAPCAPGESGQVVVSTLHNFAMPLIRYASGDYAEVAAPCACGRGLPALRRIVGRQRNMLVRPDGVRHWPSFPSEAWREIAPVAQIQLIQDAVDHIEARLVMARDLTDGEGGRLIVALQECLGYPFRITLQRVDVIPRSAGQKYEDFISLLAESAWRNARSI